jgi:hypothetical protein
LTFGPGCLTTRTASDRQDRGNEGDSLVTFVMEMQRSDERVTPDQGGSIGAAVTIATSASSTGPDHFRRAAPSASTWNRR